MSDQIFDQNLKDDLPQDFGESEPTWRDRFSGKKIIIGVSVAGIILIAGIFWYFLSGNSPSADPVSNNVVLLIKGPEQITSGNEAEYRVIFTNGEDADMIDVTLELLYPASFQFKLANPAASASSGQRFNLSNVKKGEESEVKIRGKLSGAVLEEKELKAILSYKLANFNSHFQVEATHKTLLLAPNLTLDITGPIDVISGQDVTFTVSYKNVSTTEFDNLALSVSFPSGFKFSSSAPAANKNNNYWLLSKLAPGGAGKIEITGSFTGVTNQEQIVNAELGILINNNFAPLVNSSTGFKITPSALSIALTAVPADFAHLNETIAFKIKYSNEGTIGLTDLVVTVKLEGTALDLSKLQVSEAIVTGNTITWKSATYSNLSLLAPNQTGEINFMVPIKAALTSNLKNQTIKASSQIAAKEITKPIHAADVEIKIASDLNLIVSGRYVSGALPMKVGQSTIFNLTFLVTNLSNDLEGLEVIASMPLPASSWKNVILPKEEASRLSYDPTSGKIKWKIGKLPAYSGKYTEALSVNFNLEVIPNETDQGKIIYLLKNVKGAGTDTFIDKEISSKEIIEVTTATLDDDNISREGASVE